MRSLVEGAGGYAVIVALALFERVPKFVRSRYCSAVIVSV